MIKIELSVRNIITIVGVVVGFWLVTKAWPVLLLSAVGLLLAASLMPYVDRLSANGRHRSTAVAIVLLTVLAGIALLSVLVVPTLIAQAQEMWERLPVVQAQAADFAGARGWGDLQARIETFNPTNLIGSGLVNSSRTLFDSVVAVGTTFVLAAYFLIDSRRLKRFLYFCTPRAWHRHVFHLLPALQRVVGGYIRGQVITSLAIAVFTFALLTVLGARNAVAIAAIAAIANLIPIIGTYLLFVILLPDIAADHALQRRQ
jgi:predicted PurR-regulated permease PerM